MSGPRRRERRTRRLHVAAGGTRTLAGWRSRRPPRQSVALTPRGAGPARRALPVRTHDRVLGADATGQAFAACAAAGRAAPGPGCGAGVTASAIGAAPGRSRRASGPRRRRPAPRRTRPARRQRPAASRRRRRGAGWARSATREPDVELTTNAMRRERAGSWTVPSLSRSSDAQASSSGGVRRPVAGVYESTSVSCRHGPDGRAVRPLERRAIGLAGTRVAPPPVVPRIDRTGRARPRPQPRGEAVVAGDERTGDGVPPGDGPPAAPRAREVVGLDHRRSPVARCRRRREGRPYAAPSVTTLPLPRRRGCRSGARPVLALPSTMLPSITAPSTLSRSAPGRRTSGCVVALDRHVVARGRPRTPSSAPSPVMRLPATSSRPRDASDTIAYPSVAPRSTLTLNALFRIAVTCSPLEYGDDRVADVFARSPLLTTCRPEPSDRRGPDAPGRRPPMKKRPSAVTPDDAADSAGARSCRRRGSSPRRYGASTRRRAPGDAGLARTRRREPVPCPPGS